MEFILKPFVCEGRLLLIIALAGQFEQAGRGWVNMFP